MVAVNQKPFNCLHVERALLGLMSLDELNPKELEVCQAKKPGFEIGRLAHRMAQGYYAHAAALEAARDPRSKELASTILKGIDGKPVSVGYVTRKDGMQHTFDFNFYLDYLSNPEIVGDLAKTWLVGSLLAIGDALTLTKPKYLDHAPELELLYHLRNGIAHGNKFTFKAGKGTPGLDRLKKFPAHNKQEFKIVPELEGKPVLFDFMGPGDVLDLLQSIEIHLTRIC